ncbi:MAG: single-stranded-DNA-specific exonuclease RecJ [Leptolyngbya sp. SIO4C1]|nr:single-stranded-DNA-specific exonuclease RecJ [Leptolyngbya sp. SIO4C1]
MPQQRWQIFPPQAAQAQRMAEVTQLSPLLAQVLINRGIHTPEQAWLFLDPETQQLPSPLDEFPDLPLSLELLVEAIGQQKKIAICGDYDADGMTSTALLIRALLFLGANVSYAIPSRMQEGYGINQRIVEEFHAEGVSLILTVDNGIAAYAPIARARELGLSVIVTDHHDIPEQLPPANAILNPKLLPKTSPYRGIAGVGVAYVLAVCLAQTLEKMQDLTAPLLALFTLGTIADLAPLVGVNRRWVRRGLKLLPKSRIPGVQALIEVAGLGQAQAGLKPEAIGFRLGPRINAVGRIADPQIVIDMLTTEDVGVALQRAMQCEEANQLRRRMCELIEAQAVDWCETQQQKGQLDLQQARVLVIVQPEWHHGVIGIVASRLVERYGVPVFIGTYEDKAQKEIRGSARGIPEFNVFEALCACDDLLDRYGGHRAAGGFTFPARHLRQVQARLRNYAHQHLQPSHLKPLVTVDVSANLADITLELYEQIDRLHPCGIENPDPVFWTPSATLVEQRVVGKDRKHLKLTLAQPDPVTQQPTSIRAIAWRWGEFYPLPRVLDIAYKLRLNEWQGSCSVELELIGVRLPQDPPARGIPPWSATESPVPPAPAAHSDQPPTAYPANPDSPPLAPEPQPQPRSLELPNLSPADPAAAPPNRFPAVQPSIAATLAELSAGPELSAALSATQPQRAEFFYGRRRYVSVLAPTAGTRVLKIQNAEGHLLMVQLAERQGFLQLPGEPLLPVDLSEPHYFNLLRAGLNALALKQKTALLIKKDELLDEKDRQIATLNQQIRLLEEKVSQLSAEKQQQFQALQSALAQQTTAIQDREADIVALQTQMHRRSQPPDLSAIEQQVRSAVGDSVWFCIQTETRQDLCAACKNYQMIQADGADPQIADYSEAGIRLSFAVEREIVQPFFEALAAFLQTQGTAELDSLTLNAARQAQLKLAPSLLAEQWQSFQPQALDQPAPSERVQLYTQTHASRSVSDRDRRWLAEFLAQWEHPMAAYLSQNGTAAAALIDQVSQLRHIAAQAEHFLYAWHYDLLQQLVLGGAAQRGLLRQIYGS